MEREKGTDRGKERDRERNRREIETKREREVVRDKEIINSMAFSAETSSSSRGSGQQLSAQHSIVAPGPGPVWRVTQVNKPNQPTGNCSPL